MKKISKLGSILLAVSCLPMCGAWTAPPQTAEQRYVDVNFMSSRADEVVNYTSKTVVQEIYTANNTPEYYDMGSASNTCGPVAGAIVVGFYDKYYSDMIPGWNSYMNSGRYRLMNNTYVTPVINDLYTRMGTNVAGPGVSQSEFKTGLKSYINAQNYSVTYQSVWSNNTFNYTAFGTAVSNNEVTVLFVSPSNLYLINEESGYDSYTPVSITGNHIMVAYGIYEVSYQTSSGTRVEKFLKVATGYDIISSCYYRVGSYVDAAYVVKIS